MQNFVKKEKENLQSREKRQRSTVKAAQRKSHESHTGPNETDRYRVFTFAAERQ